MDEAAGSNSVPLSILADDVAIMTGGGRDIGRACALKLAATGAINYPSSSAGAGSAVTEIVAGGGSGAVAYAAPQAAIMRNHVTNITPLKREGTSSDAANLVNCLASDEAAFVTGANIDIYGGLAFS